MEFKGTKGNFKTKYINGFIRIVDKDENNVLDTPFKQINESNAQLIAHAPEMLEMLNKCSEFLTKVQAPKTSAIYLSNEIEQLITKATTI
jgi:hypothetical protein